MKTGVLALLYFLTCAFAFGQEHVLLNADFDDANLDGWRTSGDLCVAPSFCAGEAPGKYWVAMSTNHEEDAITLCGYNSVGGLQSILRTPNLPLPATPSRIRIDFDVKFLTNENTSTNLGTDSFVVRLLTNAGPVVIVAFDDSGASPGSQNLTIAGNTRFKESNCNPNWKYETGMLHVTYYRTFREPSLSAMASGPVALEFALHNQFDRDFDSAVVLDNVRLRIQH